jgi:hypothetical protein
MLSARFRTVVVAIQCSPRLPSRSRCYGTLPVLRSCSRAHHATREHRQFTGKRLRPDRCSRRLEGSRVMVENPEAPEFLVTHDPVFSDP